MPDRRKAPAPLAFLDEDTIDALGRAGYCVFLRPDEARLVGGLLITDARGVPLEFVFGMTAATDAACCGNPEAAENTLAQALLGGCARRPLLTFFLRQGNILWSDTAALSPSDSTLLPFSLQLPVTQISPQGAEGNSPTQNLLRELEKRALLNEALARSAAGLSILADDIGEMTRIDAAGNRTNITDMVGLPVVSVPLTSKETSSCAQAILSSGENLRDRLAPVLWPSLDSMLEGGLSPWYKPLFPYQKDGIKALLSRNALLLADDMGLGKTIQAIGALRILLIRQAIRHALLVVPAGLVSQWRKEIRLWAPELRVCVVDGSAADRAWLWTVPAHLYLTGYETLRSDCTANIQSPPRRRVWDVAMLDEAQKIKNRDIEISRKCKILSRERAWALTGTPLENTEDDLASVLEFVAPVPENKTGPRYHPGLELRKKHRELQLRRKKIDVLPQLPKKIISEISLVMEGTQRAYYDRAEKEWVMELRKNENASISNILELILRLKQICNFHPLSGQSVKADDMLERLETLAAEGHRALVFSQFADAVYGVRAIEKRLAAYAPLIYTGDMTRLEREAVISEFKNNNSHKVLILSLRAGGQGLNLQDASYVFHFDRWWNPAVEHQAEDRAHRLGQMIPVTVYSYIIENTIEERIDDILRKKELLFNDLVDHVSIDKTSRLTADELFGLFGLNAPHKKTGGSGAM